MPPKADTSTFTTTLSKDLRSIYAVFVLQEGSTGRVEGDLMKGDQVLATLALKYQGEPQLGRLPHQLRVGLRARDGLRDADSLHADG